MANPIPKPFEEDLKSAWRPSRTREGSEHAGCRTRSARPDLVRFEERDAQSFLREALGDRNANHTAPDNDEIEGSRHAYRRCAFPH